MMYGGMTRKKKMYGGAMKKRKGIMLVVLHQPWKYKNLTKHASRSTKRLSLDEVWKRLQAKERP